MSLFPLCFAAPQNLESNLEAFEHFGYYRSCSLFNWVSLSNNFVKVKTNFIKLTNYLVKKIKKNCIIDFYNLLIYIILQGFTDMLKCKCYKAG
jgi:hypothetical protein